eukprot:GHRR01035720.1.p1 GENE.GHRR01035720.1~~GHRR01035720.1.p1  ORF type:complete len:581 (+),score=283.94 GHRR01035720.1:1040-2782(+)
MHCNHACPAARSDLKLAVLVNEVAELDVDGQLLSTQQTNAAAGIRPVRLSGGCACCNVSSDLQAALEELAGSSNYQHLDYLLLETSGVADAGPLADTLAAAGFRLTGVVTVIDVEAAQTVLTQDVTQAQLRAADIVVLNKCDLASLSLAACVEDSVQQLAPGVRMIRARYGQVPVPALLDFDAPAVAEPVTAQHPADGQQQQQQGSSSSSVQGEIAFLSHEPVVTAGPARLRQREGTAAARRNALNAATTAAAPAGTAASSSDLAQHQRHQKQQRHDHTGFASVVFSCELPLCMACFQAYVAQQLVPATGLFRAKGFVWLQQQRSVRYVFQFSGKQRAECGAEGQWQAPPGVQLVLIGQQQEQLQQLKQGLHDCVSGSCLCCRGAAANRTSQQQKQPNASAQRSHDPMQQGGNTALNPAAARIAEIIQQHNRFELWQHSSDNGQQHQVQHQQPGKCAAYGLSSSSGLIAFSAVGSALHGVVAEEVNAAVLRKINATPGIFCCHIKSPAALQAATGQRAAYQDVTCLQLCFTDSAEPNDAEQLWQQMLDAVAPVLRKAYQHVHSCRCDVAAEVQQVVSWQR